MNLRHFSRRIKIFFRLPWREQGLLLVVFGMSGVVRAAILLLPFAWLAPLLGKRMVESSLEVSPIMLPAVHRFRRAIALVSRYTPWESKCLVQAIVGKLLLRRLGITNTLYLGVARDTDNTLIAHAWLRCGEIFVSGGTGREQFTIVGKFADL